MTPPRFELVVSAENCPYLAWQSLVFHHTCKKQLGVVPLVVVHGDEPRLIEPYLRLEAAGGRVQRAPNHRIVSGYEYPPRNSAATLLYAWSCAEYLILCDPDIIFLGSELATAHRFEPNTMSFDAVSYLNVDNQNCEGLGEVCRRLGADIDVLRDPASSGGVPHVIPRAVQQELAREWMRSLDAFIPDVPGGVEANRAVDWLTLASMWSLRISANRVGLSPVLTRYCETNHNGNRIWPDPQHPDASLIHYCYGDVDFDKRNFPALDPRARRNLPRSPVGTFNAILRDSIDEALETFGY